MPPGDRLIMLPPKGRVVLTPHDDTTPDVPRVILPEDVTQPPIFMPGPTAPPVPPPAGTYRVDDIYSQLREVQANLPTPALVSKTSQTYHWEGADPIPAMDDAQTIWYLKGLNEQHINRDWGQGQRGSGIMYHEAIAQSGTTFVMRGAELVLWHCGNNEGNMRSRAVLVVCSRATPPTAAQLAVIRLRAADFRKYNGAGAQMFPHSRWSATECPGDTIRALVATL